VVRARADTSDPDVSTGQIIVDATTRKRAATLPPIARNRAPSVSPPGLAPPPAGVADVIVIPPIPTASHPSASGSLPAVEPVIDNAPPMRTSGPPLAVDLENAITNPPPLRRTMMPPLGSRLPASIEEDLKSTIRRGPMRTEAEATPRHIADGGGTEPPPRVEMPLRAPPPSDPSITLPGRADDHDAATTLPGDPMSRASSLAARIDAAAERDEWDANTPVVAPTRAELRSLLGVPDVTRKQSIEEIDRLHLASLDRPSDPEILPPPAIGEPRIRGLPQTAEVDPEDIEAAIELAPPARRNTLAVAKPKKPPR
jgi:hypothetical protein